MLALVLACFAAGLLIQRLVPRSRSLVPWLDHAVLSVTVPALVLDKLPELAVGADLATPVAAARGTGALAAGVALLAGRHFAWTRSPVGALLLVTPPGTTTFLGPATVELGRVTYRVTGCQTG